MSVLLQNLQGEAQEYFENLQDKYGGNLENMLELTRMSIEKSKVNVEKREQYDP